MDTMIRLKIKKDIDNATEKKILGLKGGLIAKSFTDIIHIDDEGEEFHVNYFTPNPESRQEAIAYINNYIAEASLSNIISLS